MKCKMRRNGRDHNEFSSRSEAPMPEVENFHFKYSSFMSFTQKFCLVLGLSESALVALYVPKNEKRIRTGQEVILECQVEGSLEIRFVWFK